MAVIVRFENSETGEEVEHGPFDWIEMDCHHGYYPVMNALDLSDSLHDEFAVFDPDARVWEVKDGENSRKRHYDKFVFSEEEVADMVKFAREATRND